MALFTRSQAHVRRFVSAAAAENIEPAPELPRGVTEDIGTSISGHAGAAQQPGAAAAASDGAAGAESNDEEDNDFDDGYESDDEDDDDGYDLEDDGFPREKPLEPPRGAAAARRSGLSLLADLATDGTSVVAARGGRGGRGNLHLDTDKPGSWRDRAELGAEGERRRLLLEMCSVADVGLVGPPNVGKSSLLVRLPALRCSLQSAPICSAFPCFSHPRGHHQTPLSIDTSLICVS